MEIKEEKKALRKKMLEQRLQLDKNTKAAHDAYICAQLEGLIEANNCATVHAYIPMAGEINITPLLVKLKNKGVKIICPKTLPKRQLENRVLHSLEELETGIMGTQHPLKQEVYEGPYDLIIVPGLAYDNNRYRLGYGGGYYDNFLVNQTAAIKAGIFYPFQQLHRVPTEAHDIQLDTIFSNL
jgi:5-formyltetrahydrofolate cyclo-ligase